MNEIFSEASTMRVDFHPIILIPDKSEDENLETLSLQPAGNILCRFNTLNQGIFYGKNKCSTLE
jgi:hypothetical protein